MPGAGVGARGSGGRARDTGAGEPRRAAGSGHGGQETGAGRWGSDSIEAGARELHYKDIIRARV